MESGIAGYGVYRIAKSGNLQTSTQPVTASDLGVALYPGAEQKANVSTTVFGKNSAHGNLSHLRLEGPGDYFLPKRPGSQAKVQTILNETQLTLNSGAGGMVTVKISSGMGVESGKTRIIIAHATDAATPSQ